MPFNLKKKMLRLKLLAVIFGLLASGSGIGAQEQAARKVTKRVQPVYPALASKMNLSGTVKLVAQVTPEGKVKGVRITGGNAVLASAAESAVKQWIFEAGQKETSEPVEIKFDRT